MPSLPGFTFKSNVVVAGIVEEISWGTWAIDNQEAHAFGSEGASSVQGALISREFEVPVILSGYATALLRDTAVETLEEMAGQVGALTIRLGGAVTVFTQAANIKLLAVIRGKSGFDGVHSHYRSVRFVFRQMATS